MYGARIAGLDLRATSLAGLSRDDVVAKLALYDATDRKLWRSGRISGCVYHGGDDLSDVMGEAFKRYALANPLHPDVFPSLRKVRRDELRNVQYLF